MRQVRQQQPAPTIARKQQVHWGVVEHSPPSSPGRSCTGLLDREFFDRLAEHADRFPAMASELTQLRAAAHDTRLAEKTLTAAATHPSRGIDPVQAQAEAQAARNALRNQVQRMQMVLQGHRTNLGTYTPNIAHVTHESTCRADWKHLRRVLKSIDAVGADGITDPAPAASARAQEAARCWHDLTARRQTLSQALRSVHALAEQGDWHKAGQLLRTTRPELRRLLADARQLAASGDALLLDPDAYNNLDTLLRDIPRRLDNLDRFQELLDRRQRPVEAD